MSPSEKNPPASFRCIKSRDPSGNATYSALEWEALTVSSGYISARAVC